MIPAFLATLLFSFSVVAASRSARILGSNAANFWRLFLAALMLSAWAHTFGLGVGGGAFGLFFLSGVVGFGMGDFALFQSLTRLGPRLAALMINCLAAPFAALIEWVWLGTTLTLPQVACGLLILAGVALSLAPEKQAVMPARRRLSGVLFGILAGLGQGCGAVITRKAYAVADVAGFEVDGGTSAYQRILGGLAVIALPYLWLAFRERERTRSIPSKPEAKAKRSRAWRWVVINALAGPAVGVAFFQWALKTTPSGIVLPITAMTPLAVIPLSYVFEGDRPGVRSLAGGVVAVVGVIGLTCV